MSERSNVQMAFATRGTTDFRSWALWLGEQLEAHGARGLEHHLSALARLGRRRDVNKVWCDVLADRTQPEVARMRAFAKVVARLDADPVAAERRLVA